VMLAVTYTLLKEWVADGLVEQGERSDSE
jgi:hypothetical protein